MNNLKDKLNLGNNLGVKGRVTVELRNAKTGEVEFKETKDNFIGNGYKLWAKYIQKKEILSNVLGINKIVDYSNNNYLYAPTPFIMVVLTNDDSEKDPENEFGYKGDIIGYAFRNETYSGDDSQKGTINTAETIKDKNKITHIFDFPTHAANGTFQSINFASGKLGRYGQGYAKETISGLKFNFRDKIAYRDGYIWLLMNKEIKKYNTKDNTVEDLFVLNFDSCGIDYYNGYIYITNYVSSNYESTIFKFDLEGNLVDKITTSLPYLVNPVCAEDGFWVLSDSPNTHNLTGMQYDKAIYKLDLNGNIVNYKESPIYISYKSGFDIKGDTLFLSKGREDNRYDYFKALNHINLVNGEVRAFYTYTDGLYSITAIDANKGILYGITDLNGPYCLTKIQLAGLSSRVLLTAPQTKNNAQTMKVTYELMFDDLI
ncbi:hypothetical protein SAMN02745180_00469 [Sporanaerobacter acetigenes DSM 13106]|uniref:Uncharacterized protein n=1 Tax=Sporanaerobacter acetigenes DSM 13106 TaxID=1123281 RepID=A0A1M5TZA5_9FIRM|nr:hypothetical protein SAMN02745180_00469 [Sporanaerobacter acetigenes DSM 13106]